MSALNVCLKVANIAEASGSAVAVVVFKLLELPRRSVKASQTRLLVIDTLVRMHGDHDTSCYIDICGEMETYLKGIAQEIKDFKLKHRGLRGVFCVDDFRDVIQSYKRRVEDLKTDFVIHSVVDCNLKVTQMHGVMMAQAAVHHPDEFVFRIPKKPVAITAFFF
ncbi:hypothetical protein IW261DRAFT_1527130 [Armillaria novae-zelandiae]|uniref:Uncharacterized protein n=1 Tax=Armillaria novae-zelandiae TaxID=153914 RepID=A0AA39NBX5_9AGAR|nr:hypothetical protein IW261DRAFT_1527130 [Armillaria novae-zelandiae]